MKVVITDHVFNNVETEREILSTLDADCSIHNCRTEDEVISAAKDAEGILVTFAPITERVLNNLNSCKIIVRYGIGTDNIDLKTAKAKGIKVCNVPDYGIDEVADHAMALALALVRQLPWVEKQVKAGIWSTTTQNPILACKDMQFVTLGFGRIAKAVLDRAIAFGFQLAAYDPFVDQSVMINQGIIPLTFEEAVRNADIMSLHLPLNKATHHLICYDIMQKMKKNAIIINTSRGAIINTVELAQALNEGIISAAGIDVFEEEPLPDGHPLRTVENVILTSHIAWYSEASIHRLQQAAAEEIVRGLTNEPVKNLVNI